MVAARDFVVDLKSLEKSDSPVVGNLASQLGELSHHKIHIKKGFVVTYHAFLLFLKANQLEKKISHLLGAAKFSDPQSVYNISKSIQSLISHSEIPEDIVKDITSVHKKLGYSHDPVKITYSTQTKFDVYKHELYSDVVIGDVHILHQIRALWASFFSPHVVYELGKDLITETKNGFSLIIQQIDTPLSSGVITQSLDGATSIKSVYGFWTQRSLDYDETILNSVNADILKKTNRVQPFQIILKREKLEEEKVSRYIFNHPKLNIREIHTLFLISSAVKNKLNHNFEIAWTKEDGEFYVTNLKQIKRLEVEAVKTQDGNLEIGRGKGLTSSIGIGQVFVIQSIHDYSKIKKGQIVVLKSVDMKHLDLLKKAAGIIVENGSEATQLAYFVKITQIPIIVNVSDATKVLKNGSTVTIHAKKGVVIRGSMLVHHVF